MKKKIKIFLASSDELKPERLELADFVEHLNHTLDKLDINVQLVKWEYIDTSMGIQHKQEDYNDVLRECEMCLVLYWTKFGLYTKSELDTAYSQLKSGNNPKKLYVYFKEIEGDEKRTAELEAFRDSFPKEYGHFENRFRNIDTLKSQILLQFIEYQSNTLKDSPLIEVKDGKITMGGKVYVDLMNVPFVGNNDEYTSLLKNIKKTKKLLAVTEPENEDYTEYASDLRALEEKKDKMESGLWDTALEITRLSNQKCSERLQRAIDLFSKGDNKGANAILNEEEIYRDAEQNINLIRLGEEGRKGLITNIEELKLKIKTLQNEMAEGWGEEVLKLHETIIEYTKEVYGENSEEYIASLLNASESYTDLAKYEEILHISAEALALSLERFGEDHPYAASSYNNIGCTYVDLGDYKMAMEYLKKALELRIKIFGEHHPDTAESYNNVGCSYEQLGDQKKGLEYQKKALELRIKIFGECHPSTAISYNNVGCAYENLGDHKQGLEFQGKALELRIKIFGETHPATAESYDNVGCTYVKLGDYKKGMEYLGKAYEISKSMEDTENVAEYANLLGRVYALMGETEKAREKFEEAFAMLPEDHPEAGDSRERLEALEQ